MTAANDGSVRVWDAATSKQLKKYLFDGLLRAVDLSPDGKLLAASSLDDIVHVWDTSTGREIHRLKGHGIVGGKGSLGFLADGLGLLSFGDDFSLRLWDMNTGKARLEYPIRPQGIELRAGNKNGFAVLGAKSLITPDRKNLVLAIPGQFHVFETATSKEISQIAHEGRAVSGVTISPNSKHLLASSLFQADKHLVTMLDIASRTSMQRLLLPGSMAGPVAFSPDGRMFATTADRPEREILIYETASGNLRATIRDLRGRVWSLAFFPDGRRLASGLSDGNVMIWDLTTSEHLVRAP